MEKETCERWWGERHTWGNWEVFERGEIESTIHGGIIGTYNYQKSICKICNFEEIRRQRI